MIKKTIKIISVLTCMINVCFVFFIPVFAEETTPAATYISFGDGCHVIADWVTSSNSQRYYTAKISNSDGDVRFIIIGTTLYLVSRSSFVSGSSNSYQSNQACTAYGITNTNVSSTTGYAVTSKTASNNIIDNGIIPKVSGVTATNANAVYYTFGAGAVGPTEPDDPINWGILKDVSYETAIAGNGQASLRNVDYIKWDNLYDANGNDISECQVEIRAVPGSWTGSDLQTLMEKVNTDFNTGNYGPLTLGTVNASVGTFSKSWNSIVNDLGWNFNSLYARLEDLVYLKQGWYYQIRLKAPDSYVGSWQTVYTALSSSAKGSETVLNTNNYDINVYQYMQNITKINEQTGISITINNTEYYIENPENGIPPEEDPNDQTQTIIDDLWELMKIIQQGFFNVVNSIKNAINEIKAIPGKLLEMFESLFSLGVVDQSVTDELLGLQDDYVSENQSNALNTLNVLEDIQEDIVTAADAAQTCIFEWDDVKIRIPGLNSDAVLIPAGTYNFTATFLQMINGFGMTYEEYQELVSAVIYCLTALFVYHHVTTFLKDD